MELRRRKIATVTAGLVMLAAVCMPVLQARAQYYTEISGEDGPIYFIPRSEGLWSHADALVQKLILDYTVQRIVGMSWILANFGMPASGSFLTDPALDVYASRSAVDSHLLDDDGYNQEIGAMVSGRLGEGLTLGLSITDSRYKLENEWFDYLQTAQSLDVMVLFDVADGLSLGLAASVADIDIRAGVVGNDDDIRFGASAVAMYDYDVNETCAFGFLAGISSMNKENFKRTFDDDDTSLFAGVGLDYEIVEDLTANLGGTFFGLLDKESGEADGEYVLLNAGLTYQATENIAVSVGYETVVCDNDSDENTGTVNVHYSF